MKGREGGKEIEAYLHGNETVVDHDLLCEEIGSDGGLVLVTESLVDVLVHEGGLSDAVRRLESLVSAVRKAGEEREVRTHPESPRMMTCAGRRRKKERVSKVNGRA